MYCSAPVTQRQKQITVTASPYLSPSEQTMEKDIRAQEEECRTRKETYVDAEIAEDAGTRGERMRKKRRPGQWPAKKGDNVSKY